MSLIAICRTEEDIDRLIHEQVKSAKSLLKTGKPVKITVATFESKRSLEQNALSWALYGDIARFMNRTNARVAGEGKHAEIDDQDVHDYLLREFYPEQCTSKQVGKHEIPTMPKTSRFNSMQMSHHLELIYRWCAERRIPTTEPCNDAFQKYMEAQRG